MEALSDFQKASQALEEVYWAGYYMARGSYPPDNEAKSDTRFAVLAGIAKLASVLGFTFACSWEGGHVVFPEREAK